MTEFEREHMTAQDRAWTYWAAAQRTGDEIRPKDISERLIRETWPPYWTTVSREMAPDPAQSPIHSGTEEPVTLYYNPEYMVGEYYNQILDHFLFLAQTPDLVFSHLLYPDTYQYLVDVEISFLDVESVTNQPRNEFQMTAEEWEQRVWDACFALTMKTSREVMYPAPPKD